jgi:large subunit ribosomal protein L15
MRLHDLRPPAGARREKRRVGRGNGSGQGTTAGKGTKGQKARTGGGVPPYFEGGQLPLVRRLPYRRGFKNPFRVEYAVVNVAQLAGLPAGSTVTAETLVGAGLLNRGEGPVKILGDGALSVALHVQADRVSRQAREKIEAAGGSVTELSPRQVKEEGKKSKAQDAAAGSGAGRRQQAATPAGVSAPAAESATGADALPPAAAEAAPAERPARRQRAEAAAEPTRGGAQAGTEAAGSSGAKAEAASASQAPAPGEGPGTAEEKQE